MKIKFGVKDSLEVEEYIILTHPDKRDEWGSIKNTLLNLEETINVIDAKTENNIVLKLSDVMSIQSEERRCNIVTRSGDMYEVEKF